MTRFLSVLRTNGLGLIARGRVSYFTDEEITALYTYLRDQARV